MPRIIVIGCGVIGFSSALDLQAAGYEVAIVTRDLPDETTSMAAGAMWSASDLDGQPRQWANASLNRFLRLAAVPESGVIIQRMREVFTQPLPDPWYREQLPFFARMAEADLPKGMADGYLMDVPVIAPPIYLQWLHEQFVRAGGKIEQRHVTSFSELAEEADVLVNCSGVGARDLADDESVYPIRGQTVLVDAPEITAGYMEHSDVVHIFPRADGVLLGGIKRAHDWDRRIDPEIQRDFFANCARIEPSLRDAPELRHFSGLRPGRHAVRLELERLSSGSLVIHNYGHAAIGYTLSWGCAEAVLRLMHEHLNSPDPGAQP